MPKRRALEQAEKETETIEWPMVTLISATAGIVTPILVRAELGRPVDVALKGQSGG